MFARRSVEMPSSSFSSSAPGRPPRAAPRPPRSAGGRRRRRLLGGLRVAVRVALTSAVVEHRGLAPSPISAAPPPGSIPPPRRLRPSCRSRPRRRGRGRMRAAAGSNLRIEPPAAREFKGRLTRLVRRTLHRPRHPSKQIPYNLCKENLTAIQADRSSRLGGIARFASVYPLVTARALAAAVHLRGAATTSSKGAVVAVRFGRQRARAGSSSSVDEAPPDGIEAVADRARRRASCRPRSSTSRSGSPTTTARRRRARWRSSRRACAKRRGERPPPAEREALAGEAEPARADATSSAPRSRASSAALDGGGGRFLLYGATGSGKTEVYLQACAAALERGLGAIVLVPEIALAPQTRRPLPRALRRPRRDPALGADRRRAARRARADRERRGARSSSARARRSSRRCAASA